MAAPVIFNQMPSQMPTAAAQGLADAAPTTPPLPTGPAPQSQAAPGSPLHDAVRQAVAAHPNATPVQIAQGLTMVGGIDPALAQRVVADVMGGGQTTPPQGSGPLAPNGASPGGTGQTTPPMVSGALSPSDAGGTPGPWQSPAADRTTPPVTQSGPQGPSAIGAANATRLSNMQAAIDKVTPNMLGPTAPIANTNRLAALQAQEDNPTTPPTTVPSAAPGRVPEQSPQAASSNPLATTPPLPDFGTMSTPAFTSWMANQAPTGGANSPDDQTTPPGDAQPAGTSTASTTPPAPTGQPQKGPNKWVAALENLAPAAAALMIGSHNPEAGTAFLGNWQNAKEQQQAKAAQQKQVDVENARANQQETDRQQGLKIDQEKVDQAKATADGKLDATSEKQMWVDLNNATSGGAALAIVNKYDPDGTKLGGVRQILVGADGTPVSTNPYSTKAGTLAEKSSQDYARDQHWSKQDMVAAGRADSLAKQVNARADELEAVAHLDKSREGYIDTQTKQLVPMDQAIERLRNAQSTFLGVRTTDQPDLDHSLIGLRGDQGWSDVTNAQTGRDVAGIKAAMAKEGINVDEAKISQIMGKDGTFNANLSLLKQAIAERQQAQSSATLAQDPVQQKRVIDDIDNRIAMHWGNIKGRVNGNGAPVGRSAPLPSQAPSVPDVSPAGAPPVSGRDARTARSTNWKNSQVALSTGPVTLGKLTQQQYRQLSPTDQSVYYHGMQQLNAMRNK